MTLSLTDRGESLVREMNAGVEDAYRQLLVGASADDIDGFVNTIQRIRTNFQSMNSA